MVTETININELTEDMIRKYFPLLTPQRRQKIAETETAEERSLLLCGEMLARRCLSQLLDAPEFSFKLLCNINTKSILGNYKANYYIAAKDDTVVCVADEKPVGVHFCEIAPFSFKQAQEKFTDKELRHIFAPSAYSFAHIVNMPECSEKEVISEYALFTAMKEAMFIASGRGIRDNYKKYEFTYDGEKYICSQQGFEVLVNEKAFCGKYALAAVRRNY